MNVTNKFENKIKKLILVGNYVEDVPTSMGMYGGEEKKNWRSFRKVFLYNKY